MARSRPVMSGRTAATIRATSIASPTRSTPLAWNLALLATLVAGAVAFQGALAYFFAQDDFAGLARASGLLPRLSGPWRYLSGQTYFDVMHTAAGLAPRPYHLFSLIAHLGCVAALFSLLTRRFGTAAGLVGATFFAVHPALFTALYSISGIGEILALLFGLGALLVADAEDGRRFLAMPMFAASLLCKESMLLLPVAVWLLSPGRAARRGFSSAIALGVVSIAYLAYFVVSDKFGVRTALPETAPYAFGLGSHWLTNFLSYVGWTWNFVLFTVSGFTDAVDTRVFPWAIGGLALWVAGGFSPALRARGWLRGGALYLLFLLPVLPLKNHTYHYYLYAPLVGAAYGVAVLFAVAVADAGARGPARASRTVWALALTIAILLTANGALLVRKIETHPFSFPGLRADPTVDRARIALQVRNSLDDAELPPGARLRFFSPASIALASAPDSLGSGPGAETYWERNVRNALMDGLAVRVLFPNVSEVEFVRSFSAADPGVFWAVYRPEGDLRVATTPELDSLMTAFRTPR